MMDNYEHWQLQIDDRIATLTMTRGAQRNALTPAALFELRSLAQLLQQDREVWCVIVQAEGEHFSVGMDVNAIGKMMGMGSHAFQEGLRQLQQCFDVFEQLSKPTIAKIQSGYCLGGGLIFALCCDFRIAAEGATFGFPEVKRSLGVVMGAQRVVRVAGAAATKEMFLLGERFPAERALQYGLLHRVVPEDELDGAVLMWANKFRSLPPLAVSVNKKIIDEGRLLSLRQSQELEISYQEKIIHSEDFQEAIASFFGKRPPHYKGE